MKKEYFILFFALNVCLLSAQNITSAISSGNWSESSTWDNGIPNNNKRAIIKKGISVKLSGNHDAKELVIHGTLDIIDDASNKSLSTRWIHVNSGGQFNIGSASDRFERGTFVLTLTGTNPNSDQNVPMANGMNMSINKNDGFLMAAGGGRLQFFGKDRISFTKLSQTAKSGDNSIVVANIIDRNHDGNLSASLDGEFNWEVGDEIVIASSSVDYSKEDVRKITRIQRDGSNTRLTLDRGLSHRHYGKIETYANNFDPQSFNKDRQPMDIDLRAEVALLSRNIIIKGLESQDTDNNFGDRQRLTTGNNGKASNGVGGHIMIMPTAGQISVEGVQLDLMGQSGRLGRYPFHWHVARNRAGDVFKNSSITNSNNRAVIVHTTDNVIVEGVVAHDIHGHGFFTEDGVEEGNLFLNNIAYGIHRVHDNAFKGKAFIVDDTDRFHDGGDRFRTTSAFWIANGANDFIGNVCAGSQGSGYWYAPPTNPRGPSGNIPEYNNYRPKEVPVSIFKNNSVHSTVTGFVTVARGVNGGGEFKQNENFFGNIDPVFENLTVYQTKVGVYPLMTNVRHIFKNFKAADIETINNDSDPTMYDGGLFVGYSRGNPYNDRVIGTVFYHGNTIFKDIHIAGFNKGHESIMFKSTNGNRVRPACEVEGLSFEDDKSFDNMTAAQITNYRNTREVYDRDGSLTTKFGGGPGYTFIGNDSWMVTDEDAPSSGFRWVLSRKRFGNLQTRHGGNDGTIPKITLTAPHGETRNFTIEKLGHRRAQLQLGKEYRMNFPNGFNTSNNQMELTLHQWSKPANSVGVVLRMVDMGGVIKPRVSISHIDLPQLNSLADLRNSNRDAYFKSNRDLYVKLMNRSKGTHEGYIEFVSASNQCGGSNVVLGEYQLEGTWNEFNDEDLYIDQGTEIKLSGSPNNNNYTIQLPNGNEVSDNYVINRFSSNNEGTYTIKNQFGCNRKVKIRLKSTKVQHIAIGKPTKQSSTSQGDGASRAVDGDINGLRNKNSVSYTNRERSWWRVDLQGVYNISSIIVNNEIGNPGRLAQADLYVGLIDSTNPNDYTKIGDLSGNMINPFEGLNVEGRYVMVRRENSEHLGLAEVEVYGVLTNCSDSITTEYYLDNEWQQGASELVLDPGDEIIISALPNPNNYTITTPDNRTFSADYAINNFTNNDKGIYTITNPLGCSTTLELKSSILSVDDINLNDNTFGMKVYPNPAFNKITVDVNDSGIQGIINLNVVDKLGRLIHTNSKTTSGNEISFSLDVVNWSSGLYFVVLNHGNKKVVSKVIIDRK